MLIHTDFDLCILCIENPPDSREHIFPESIAGRFQAKILCVSCNNNRGSELAKSIQQDSWYLTALNKLQDELPDLHSRTTFRYGNRASDGTLIKSSLLRGKHQVETSSANGTTAADETVMPKIIQGKLAKAGHADSEIRGWKEKCLAMPPNTEILLPNGHLLRKQQGPPLVPKFESHCTCEVAVLLIGYEFLALLIGNKIYGDQFSYIRDSIKSSLRIVPLRKEYIKIPPGASWGRSAPRSRSA